MVKSTVASYESQEKNGHKFKFSINLRRKLSSKNFCRKRHSRFPLNSTIPELSGSGWLAAEPERGEPHLWGRPQTHRLRPWASRRSARATQASFRIMGYNESRWSSARTLETMIDFQQTVRGCRLRSCGAIGSNWRCARVWTSKPPLVHASRWNFALVRADHRPGRAGADTGSETSDRSVPGLVPDESAHHVDHPDRQSCRFGFCGLVAALVLRARPRLGVRVAVGPLVFLATLTLLLSCRWLHVLACLVLAFLFAFRLTRRIESSLPPSGGWSSARCPRWRGWWPP